MKAIGIQARRRSLKLATPSRSRARFRVSSGPINVHVQLHRCLPLQFRLDLIRLLNDEEENAVYFTMLETSTPSAVGGDQVPPASQRVAELTRLAALLQQTSMDEEDGHLQVPQSTEGSRQDRIAALASQLSLFNFITKRRARVRMPSSFIRKARPQIAREAPAKPPEPDSEDQRGQSPNNPCAPRQRGICGCLWPRSLTDLVIKRHVHPV